MREANLGLGLELELEGEREMRVVWMEAMADGCEVGIEGKMTRESFDCVLFCCGLGLRKISAETDGQDKTRHFEWNSLTHFSFCCSHFCALDI